MQDRSLYLRQILVTEIGLEGQTRLAQGTAAVGGAGLAHEVATRYALGAGMARVVEGAIDLGAAAPDFLVDPATRAVAAGARAALRAMRLALETKAVP